MNASTLRALLVLGRVSNVPTVWSNCLAGWWLGGGQTLRHLPWLLAGTTLLYIGGMYLNDAFDENFDRRYRAERPIAAGLVSADTVWGLGLLWLALGLGCLAGVGGGPLIVGLFLVGFILWYDAVHKRTPLAPLLMGVCRCLLYLTAAAAGAEGVTGAAAWCGLALAGYVIGLSYLARRESTGGSLRRWPLALLLLPVLLGQLMNTGEFRVAAWFVSAILVLWLLMCLRPTLWSEEPAIGRTVSGLLAGIVLVDWLALANAPREFGWVMVWLFLLALFFQRFVPAT